VSGKRSGKGIAGLWFDIDVIALVMSAIIKMVVLSGVAPCSKRADDTFKRFRRKIIPRQANKTVFWQAQSHISIPVLSLSFPEG